MTYVGAEVVLGYDWLQATLLADSGVNAITTDIFQDRAPSTAAYPFIVIQNQLATDVMGVGTARIITDTSFIVKSIAQSETYTSLIPLSEAIDLALHGTTGSLSGGSVFACVREESFRFSETEDGDHFKHLGGVYKLQLQG